MEMAEILEIGLFVDDLLMFAMAISSGKLGKFILYWWIWRKTNLDVATTICNYLDLKRPKKFVFFSDTIRKGCRLGHDRRYAIDSSFITSETNWQTCIN